MTKLAWDSIGKGLPARAGMSGVDDAGGPRGARAPGASGDEPRRHGGWHTRRVLQLLPQVGDPGRAPERRERSLHADRIVRPAAPRRRSPRGRTFSGAVVHHVSRSYPPAHGRTLERPEGTTSRARVRLRVPGYDRAGSGTTARARVRLRVPGYDRAVEPTHSAPTGSRLAAARSVTTFAQSCRRGVVACTRRPHPARHGRPPPVRRPASRSIVEQGPYSTYRARIPNPDS